MPTQAAMPLNSNQKNTPLKPHRVVMFDRRNDTTHKLEKNNEISKVSCLERIILIDSNLIAPFALSCNDCLHYMRVFTRMHRRHADTLTFHVRPVFHCDCFINVIGRDVFHDGLHGERCSKGCVSREPETGTAPILVISDV